MKHTGEGERSKKGPSGFRGGPFNGGRGVFWEGDLTSVSTCGQVIMEDSGSCSFPRNSTLGILELTSLINSYRILSGL